MTAVEADAVTMSICNEKKALNQVYDCYRRKLKRKLPTDGAFSRGERYHALD